MTGKHHRGRKSRTYRGAISEWRRGKKTAGEWVEKPGPCAMTFPDGRRCTNESAGSFGYCESCWKSSR